MARIYFARHGQSEANILREFSNRGRRHPLTTLGREQALTLAVRLRAESIPRIYSSPLLRATETAQLLAEAWGAEVEVTDALREFDTGILEGTSADAGWTIYDEVVSAWMRGDWERRIEGGESFIDMRDRFVPFVQRLVTTYRDTEDRVMLVSHGGLYRAMLPLVLANVDAAFADANIFPNTGYVIAEIHPSGLYAVEWCGTPL
jgi:probable phosphoglycerate mutase